MEDAKAELQEEVRVARESLLHELDDIFDGAKIRSCTRLSLVIEALIDAKIKERA